MPLTRVEAQCAILLELWRFAWERTGPSHLREPYYLKNVRGRPVVCPIRFCTSFYVLVLNPGSILFGVAALLLAFTSIGAYSQDSARFNFGVGIGPNPIHNAGRNLDIGWNAGIRGGVNMGQHVDANLDASYSEFGLTSTALALFGETRGTVAVWSLNFQPRLHLAPRRSRTNAYAMAGFGIFHRKLSLGRPVLAKGVFCDPFFGCYPITQTGEQDVDSFTTLKPGFNVGSGLEFRIGESRAKIFAEGRYQRMFTNHGSDFSYLPVTFGVSW